MRPVLLFAMMGAAVIGGSLAHAQTEAKPAPPRGLDQALDGKPSDETPRPEEHRRGTRGDWDDDNWNDDWDWDDGWNDRDRGRRGRGTRGDTVRLTCGSEDYRYRLCDVRGRIDAVRLVRQRSWAPCREGSDWGWSARRGGLWVDNGCEAEFRVSLRGRDGRRGRGGYDRDRDRDWNAAYAPSRLVAACVQEAEYAYGRNLRLSRIVRAEEGRRGWTLALRLEAEGRDRWDRRRGQGRYDVTCRSGRRGVQIAAR